MPTAILRAVATADTASAEARLASLGQKINRIGTAGGKQMSAFGVAARVGFAAAGVAALTFAAQSVKAYREQQVVLTQLQAALKRSPALIGATTQEFQKQATALQRLTGFQDEEILAVDTILSRFNLTAQQLHTVTPLVLDYARATGKDATDAAGMIGRALLGNARALKLVGINFKATGNTAKDATTIMEKLRLKVGGTAEAFGRTAAGKVEILKAELNDFQEVVGKLVSEGLAPVLSVLNSVLILINKLPGPVKSGAVVVIGLTGAMVGLGLAVRVLRVSLGELGIQLGATAAAEGTATVATGGLAAATRGLIFGPAGLVVAIAAMGVLAAKHITDAGNARSHAKAVEEFTRRLADGSATVRSLSAEINRMPIPVYAKEFLRRALSEASRAVKDVGVQIGGVTQISIEANKVLGQTAGMFGTVAGQARTAASQVAAYLNNLRNLANTPVPIFGHPKPRQHGGVAGSNEWAWVGERGPELVHFRGGERVFTNAQSQRMAGGGGMTIVFQGPVYGMPDFKRQVRRAMDEVVLDRMRF
jgi:hypothetical protein